MSEIKLYTYTRSFYPYIYGNKRQTIFAAFFVVEEGKMIKRSISECCFYNNDYPAEIEAIKEGVRWVVANVDSMRDVNLRVVLVGGGRNDIKKTIDDGSVFWTAFEKVEHDPESIIHSLVDISGLLKMFNKVTFETSSRVTTIDEEYGEEVKFDAYSTLNKVFALLYGDDSNFGHKVYDTISSDDGVSHMVLVGKPELRWLNGVPVTEWGL